jgi:hypothetical protein
MYSARHFILRGKRARPMLSFSMIARKHFWMGLLAAAWPVALLAASPARLTIGNGWAWVREFFPPSGAGEITRMVWTNPPPQLELDSLQVWNVRRPWPVQEYGWSGPSPAPVFPESGPIVWRPVQAPAPLAREQIEMTLAEPMSDRMGHSLTYRLPGLDWDAFYQITVRGVGPESLDAVQVDLAGYLRIRNRSGREFPSAQISLSGSDMPGPPPARPFGQLALDPNNPLTDLWLQPPKAGEPLPTFYPLQTKANLPANGQTEIRFAHVLRKPANIVHICDSDQVPLPTPADGMPLERVLQIPNTSAVGLGFPLPPGEANLFFGARRGAPSLSGRVMHTPYPGTLMLEMGAVEAVRARRLADSPVALPEGGTQREHSVILVNRLTTPVHVRVVEKPDTPMYWRVIRSSEPLQETKETLTFEITLPAHSTRTITYRLHMSERAQP